jgi:aspartate/methionine/tyrosine aminotransferase
VPRIPEHILHTPHSGIRRMLELAASVADPLMLVSGDPDFTTPEHIIDGAAAAARGGATGYSPSAGIQPLREAIAQKVAARNGLDTDVPGVCVTTGGCGALFSSMLVLVEPGSEVLVPDPGWSNYAAIVHALHSTAVGYRLDAADGFAIDVADLEARITPRTRAILLNSPNNPTGTVERATRLRAVLALAEQHDLWVISDECYDELVFEGRHVSTATLGDPSRVISIFTFSKTYAMTGWRVGYLVAHPDVARQIALHQEPVVSCASTISQHAALTALRGPQDIVGTMVAAYRGRRDAAIAELEAAGVPTVRPGGSFFLMADIRSTGLGSWAFAQTLLERTGVAVVPGAAFGPAGDGYVRISLAVAQDVVTEGTRRLGGLVRELGAG